MKQVLELEKRLNSELPFDQKYPEYDPLDGRIHFLYIGPDNTAFGYYRMILPALEINSNQKHSAIVTHIRKHDFTKEFENYENFLNPDLITWADVIIFPTITSDFSYVFDTIRSFNPSAKLVMELDRNLHILQKKAPFSDKITDKQLDALQGNICAMDILSSNNESLLVAYKGGILHVDPNSTIEIHQFPNLLSSIGYEHLAITSDEPNKKLQIGIIGVAYCDLDRKITTKLINELLTLYKDTIEITVLGYVPQALKKDLEDGKQISIAKELPFFDRFTRLQDLKLDLAIAPYKHTSTDHYHFSSAVFMELAVLGIPTILPSKIPQIESYIIHGENGELADTYKHYLESATALIESAEKREYISQNALKGVWKDFIFSPRRLDQYINLFV